MRVSCLFCFFKHNLTIIYKAQLFSGNLGHILITLHVFSLFLDGVRSLRFLFDLGFQPGNRRIVLLNRPMHGTAFYTDYTQKHTDNHGDHQHTDQILPVILAGPVRSLLKSCFRHYSFVLPDLFFSFRIVSNDHTLRFYLF